MAMAAKTDDQTATPSEAPEKDSPLLDLSDAAVKKFIKTAKARGFVTLDALNAVLPSEEVSPDQIEDTMSMLSDMGITVVESEDPEEAAAPQDGDDSEEEEPSRAVTVTTSSEPNVLTVPREALHSESGKYYVFRVVSGILERTPVTTGTISLTQVAVTSGLTDGDVVATGSLSGVALEEGVPVKVVR